MVYPKQREGKNTHISDGILTPQWSIAWFIVAAAFVAIGAIEISKRRKLNPVYMSIVGLFRCSRFRDFSLAHTCPSHWIMLASNRNSHGSHDNGPFQC